MFERELDKLEGESTQGLPSSAELNQKMLDFTKELREKADQLIEKILACLDHKPGTSHNDLYTLISQKKEVNQEESEIASCGFKF